MLQGQASDIAIQTNEILTLRARLNELYVKHTGQSLSLIGTDPKLSNVYTPNLIKRCGDMIACNAAETLERDTFKSASESRDFGLIDEVIDKRPLDQPVAK